MSAFLLLGCSPESAQKQEGGQWRPPVQAVNNWGGANDAPKDLTWKTVVAGKSEPGERLIVKGTVFQQDMKTPAENVLLYVYQTDATGLYKRDGRDRNDPNWGHGTLRGWMLTGKDGKYEFETIRPAPYPDSDNPAHIHVTVTAPGYDEYWIESFKFVGDPLLEEGEEKEYPLGGFLHLLEPKKDEAGILKASRDIRLLPRD
jgi:protocatechuate 3,4-dioxygenase beta subunit